MILNIHGFAGKSTNTNYSILTELGCSVISPQLDYEAETIEETYKKLSKLVSENDITQIVATSYGSFFGKLLSTQYNIPLLATNPCLRPDISLAAIAPEYVYKNRKAISKIVRENSCSDFSDDCFVLGDNDTVIDHSLTRNIAKKATIEVVPGGHSLETKPYTIETFRRLLQM